MTLRAFNPTTFTGQAQQAPGWQGVHTPGAGGGPVLTPTRTKVYGMQRVYGLLDDSGSVSGSKAAAINVSFNDMVSHLAAPGFRDGFALTLITFDDTAKVEFEHAQPSAVLGQSSVVGRGGTDIHAAMLAANSSRRAWTPRPDQQELAPPVYVLMTDGCTCNAEAALAEAEAAKREGVTIVTVGFGGDADRSLLSQMATSPAHAKFAASAQELREFFAQVGATLRDSQRNGQNPANALAGNGP